MRISIHNFKSITSVVDFELLPLTILSGTNSSGKSSFIQILLLLKQTIELDSAQFPLYLEGKLFPVRQYSDILSSLTNGGKLKVSLVFNKWELEKYKDFPEIGLYKVFDDYSLSISFEFDTKEDNIYVSHFETKIIIHEYKTKPEQFIRCITNDKNYDVKTNVAVFSNENLYENPDQYQIKMISYSAFIPTNYEIEYVDVHNNIIKEVQKLKLDGIKTMIKDYFTSINYIGPARDEPKEEYRRIGKHMTVGIHGEFTAEVLDAFALKNISYWKIKEFNESVEYIKFEGVFIDAVKYWICEKFRLCTDIYSKNIGDLFVLYVKDFMGVESNIRHVGFGISQILPIIIEGLRMSDGETLIVEQPEVHLHPKLQCHLCDFLICMIKEGKRIIVETHSDHFITRLRRRIAEDELNLLNDKVALTFVETSSSGLVFRSIKVDEMGGLDYFPENFIENPDIELRAILKAQMNKRLKLKKI